MEKKTTVTIIKEKTSKGTGTKMFCVAWVERVAYEEFVEGKNIEDIKKKFFEGKIRPSDELEGELEEGSLQIDGVTVKSSKILED